MTSPSVSNEVFSRAAAQLGLSSTSDVPYEYARELKKLIEYYPEHTNFRVWLQPGSGYGILQCLERGCNEVTIALTPSITLGDGGRSIGFGSLSSYLSHINDNHSHKREPFSSLTHERLSIPPISRTPTPVANTGSSPMPSSTSQVPSEQRPLKRTYDTHFSAQPSRPLAAPATKKARAWPKPALPPPAHRPGLSTPSWTKGKPYTSSRSASASSSTHKSSRSSLLATASRAASTNAEQRLRDEIKQLEEQLNRQLPMATVMALTRRLGEAKSSLAHLARDDAGWRTDTDVDVSESESANALESESGSGSASPPRYVPASTRAGPFESEAPVHISEDEEEAAEVRRTENAIVFEAPQPRAPVFGMPSLMWGSSVNTDEDHAEKMPVEEELLTPVVPPRMSFASRSHVVPNSPQHVSTAYVPVKRESPPLSFNTWGKVPPPLVSTAPSPLMSTDVSNALQTTSASGLVKAESSAPFAGFSQQPSENTFGGLPLSGTTSVPVPSSSQLFDPNQEFNTHWSMASDNNPVNADAALSLSAPHEDNTIAESQPAPWEDFESWFGAPLPLESFPLHAGVPEAPISLEEVLGDASQMDTLHADPFTGNSVTVNQNVGGAGTYSGDSGHSSTTDIDRFLMNTGNAEHFDGNASVDKALEKLGLTNLYALIAGMKVSLLPHQAIGVAWMVAHEEGNEKGGIMADEMGLGKTVQMIALMMKRPPQDPARKTTLIVVPVALLDQWLAEIETKTDGRLKCIIYHGPKRPKDLSVLRQHDVILTSHSTLALEWFDWEGEEKKAERASKKKKSKPSNNFIVDDDDSSNSRSIASKNKKKKTDGPLYMLDFYRVVVDEAQNVRNSRTRLSRAITHLEAEYRWLLTGTPIVNTLTDAFAYMRFLQIGPWNEWENFRNHISQVEKHRPTLASNRLQAIFATTLIRRKKDSQLDGKRLIELPEKTVSLERLEFSREERDIYKMVETRSQEVFNKYLRAGTVLKHYAHVLILLLRLRQICSHPSLITEDDGNEDHFEHLDTEDHKEELARALRLGGLDFVRTTRDRMKRVMSARMEAEKNSADASIEDEECPICFDHFTDPVITLCSHQFCRGCIMTVFDTPEPDYSESTQKLTDGERPCPSCREPLRSNKVFSRNIFQPNDSDDSDESDRFQSSEADVAEAERLLTGSSKNRPSSRPRRKPKRVVLSSDDEEFETKDSELSNSGARANSDEHGKGARRGPKQHLRKQPSKSKATPQGDSYSDALVISSSDEERHSDEDSDIVFIEKPNRSHATQFSNLRPKKFSKFLPSTKMKFMMESLKQWLIEHPDEKTIVVSQWTQCLDLVSQYLREEHFKHIKYQGNMARWEREDAVKAFMTDDTVQVMLMSLKCGGVGLNLTRANRVISLDLGWSEAVEAQAFDRVHRLGQHRPVFVNRLVISNTVEDRVLALQERKKSLADGSLGEGSGKKIGRLSVRELANLFGLDHRGNVL